MKGDNYATIEPLPNTDNQEIPKEHGLCKPLCENVCVREKSYFF
jgi:hypothetical protein